MRFIYLPDWIEFDKKLPAERQPVNIVLSNGRIVQKNYSGFDPKLPIQPLLWQPIKPKQSCASG